MTCEWWYHGDLGCNVFIHTHTNIDICLHTLISTWCACTHWYSQNLYLLLQESRIKSNIHYGQWFICRTSLTHGPVANHNTYMHVLRLTTVVLCCAVLCCVVLCCVFWSRVLSDSSILIFPNGSFSNLNKLLTLYCDVMWCDVMWYDVMWYDMMWHDMWYDLMLYDMSVATPIM